MILRRKWCPAVFLLLAVIQVPGTLADKDNINSFRRLGDITLIATAAEALGKTGPVGTKDAPVDGRDGMPHEGPFIETNAERSRKKNKEVSDEEWKPATLRANVNKDMPVSNDGVMDDAGRRGPAEGTRGTEGGVSGKSSSKFSDKNKKPDPPKESPPLPHSETEKMTDKMKEEMKIVAEGTEDRKTLAKPSDLPEKPHDIPLPENPSSPKDKTFLSHTDPSTSTSKSQPQEEESAVIQPLHSLFLSFTMIIFSEIGDKTFLVAALMAMRHDRWVVFSAAFSALITMTVLSAFLGHAVPSLIPKWLTTFLAAGLFLVFGVKMLLEARAMSPDDGVGEEMKEVEMELEEKEHQAAQQRRSSRRRGSSISPYVLESGRAGKSHRLSSPSPSSGVSSRDASPSSSRNTTSLSSLLSGVNNLFSLILSPAWVQTFVMTFLGEWGDRSQIATIAMAAGQDYWYVIVGALVGHGCCTAGAVIGGKAIAGRISVKTVTTGGAVAFLVFGFIYLFEAIY